MASDGETTCTNDPNFAVIYSFLKVFGKLYGLEIPSITKLQESIEDTQEGNCCKLFLVCIAIQTITFVSSFFV